MKYGIEELFFIVHSAINFVLSVSVERSTMICDEMCRGAGGRDVELVDNNLHNVG